MCGVKHEVGSITVLLITCMIGDVMLVKRRIREPNIFGNHFMSDMYLCVMT